MTVRTSTPGTEATGDVWTTTLIDKLPGGWLGRVQTTANQTAITTVTDLTGLTLTVTYQTGRTYLWTATLNLQSNASSDYFGLNLTDTVPTTMKQWLLLTLASANNDLAYTHSFYEVAGSSGSVTRKLRGGRAGASTGTFQVSASATSPCQLTCIDLGL